MELLLDRTDRGSESTSGNLSVSDEGGDRVCHTVEDRIRTGPKVHGETAPSSNITMNAGTGIGAYRTFSLSLNSLGSTYTPVSTTATVMAVC